MESQNLNFYHLGIAPKMLEVLDKMKFVTPTPIQHKAIPVALEDKDLVGIAQTGTGKTFSFGIPMVQKLGATGGHGLVLVPTRELAIQVNEALQAILKPFNLTSIVLIGGMPIFKQVRGLKKNPNIIVATPGRLIDHMNQKTATVANVSVLVLDEADRMFDMGFAPDIKRIVREIPEDRQTMLYSATMPKAVMELATKYMRLPMQIEIAPEGTTAETISQELFIVKEENKITILEHLLQQFRGSVLLFVRTKIRAKKMVRKVKELGHKAAEIHSDRTMAQRKHAIEGFKDGRFKVLIATDVAARGIDVDGIELVINYDIPEDLENYVHRIGRTGRAGDEGHAVTLATPRQGGEVTKIERMIRKELPIGEHPDLSSEEFEKNVKKSGGRNMRGRGRDRERKRERGSAGGKGKGKPKGRRDAAKPFPKKNVSEKRRASADKGLTQKKEVSKEKVSSEESRFPRKKGSEGGRRFSSDARYGRDKSAKRNRRSGERNKSGHRKGPGKPKVSEEEKKSSPEARSYQNRSSYSHERFSKGGDAPKKNQKSNTKSNFSRAKQNRKGKSKKRPSNSVTSTSRSRPRKSRPPKRNKK